MGGWGGGRRFPLPLLKCSYVGHRTHAGVKVGYPSSHVNGTSIDGLLEVVIRERLRKIVTGETSGCETYSPEKIYSIFGSIIKNIGWPVFHSVDKFNAF